MYDALISKTQNKLHSLGFELARCNDPYRLFHLLQSYSEDIQKLEDEAYGLVKELEKCQS